MPPRDPDEPSRLRDEFAKPFDPDELKWKPQSVKGDRCLAIAYIDARHVADRLDAVVGVAGWQDDYTLLPDGSVVCRLAVRVGGEWLTKSDVGSLSEQPDAGDRLKAAFSDALKRAAVKFGVGRYLYRLESGWVAYDAKSKSIPAPPALPPWAVPADLYECGEDRAKALESLNRSVCDKLKKDADASLKAILKDAGVPKLEKLTVRECNALMKRINAKIVALAGGAS